MILIPTSIIHGILVFGTDCFSFPTYCAVGSVMLYIKLMITVQPTMYGGGLQPSGVVLGSSLVAVIDDIIDNIYAFQQKRQNKFIHSSVSA